MYRSSVIYFKLLSRYTDIHTDRTDCLPEPLSVVAVPNIVLHWLLLNTMSVSTKVTALFWSTGNVWNSET